MDENFVSTNAVLIQPQGADLLVRAEFNGHHACRIYDSATGKPVLMKKSAAGYVYKGEDVELGIKCELQLTTSASGYEIKDVEFQCHKLWECGSGAGVDFKAIYSAKEKTTQRCEDYLQLK